MATAVSVPLRVGGEVFDVPLSTLAATPEGSYFRALLRFYDLEDAADGGADAARGALADVLARHGGALPLDEDADTFRALLSFLRNQHAPAFAGHAGERLLPEGEPQRAMLRAAAERLGLTDLALRLTPPADVVGHLTPGCARALLLAGRCGDTAPPDAAPTTLARACIRAPQ